MQNETRHSDSFLEETLKPHTDNIRDVIVDYLQKSSVLSGSVLKDDVSAEDVRRSIKKLLDESLDAVAGGNSFPPKEAEATKAISGAAAKKDMSGVESPVFDSLTDNKFLKEHIAASLSPIWGGRGTLEDFMDEEDLERLAGKLALSLKAVESVLPSGARKFDGADRLRPLGL